MKRILIVAAAIAVLLVGCSQTTHYPYVWYLNSDLTNDNRSRKIEVREGYELSEGHSWDIIETEQGYDLVLHFIEKETE